MTQSTATRGTHTRAEILSQPRCWADCIRAVEAWGPVGEINKYFSDVEEWLFIGCGSSYYIALSAAASWTAVTGQRARAVAASELLLYPDLVMMGTKKFAPVLISRSGRTSEVLRAGEWLAQQKIPTFAISCSPNQPLEKIATTTLLLLAADEQSTVMTRSFTSMLLSLQYCATQLKKDAPLAQALRRLPDATSELLTDLHPRIEDFVSAHTFDDYVCLGQGPLFGIASESTLKLTEMSVSYAQCFHTLEFRHGPKSIVSPRTLITFLLSESSYDAECEVLEEIKGLGGTTLVVTNRADERARESADLLVELQLDLPELARLAPFLFAGQLTGLHTGLKKGLDPDNPKNLSRVVILDEDESPERPQHAAL
ncbi:MAG TPA: SIS domain-containing protein [Terriglobales bacterium]|jgi:glucosamine--fructose-6-phosphate aminotransferase (isomerizing)